jgi:hypothetical protein
MPERFSLYFTMDDKDWTRELYLCPFDEKFQSALIRLTQGPAAALIKEVRVTDGGDWLVLQWREGKLLFPTAADLSAARKNPRIDGIQRILTELGRRLDKTPPDEFYPDINFDTLIDVIQDDGGCSRAQAEAQATALIAQPEYTKFIAAWRRKRTPRTRARTHRNPEQYVQVAALPSALQRALAAIRYGRKDIVVDTAATYTVAGMSGEGRRAITVAVNLATGEFNTTVGAWGGPTPWDKRQADLDTTPRPVPVNGAVIKATEGGGQPVYAHVIVHPTNVMAQVAAVEDMSLEVAFALAAICSLTSAGRRDAFERARWSTPSLRLGTFGADNPHVQDVVRRGWATVNKVGAVTATTAGRNARKQAEELLRARGIYVP